MRTRSAFLLLFSCVLLLGGTSAAHANDAREEYRKTWSSLLDKRQYSEAKTTCSGWLNGADRGQRVEAHLCLAYADYFLSESGKLGVVQQKDAGGAFIRPAYDDKGIDSSLAHIAKAIALEPNNIAPHKLRLDVLMKTGRYSETPKALESSLGVYRGDNIANRWLDYAPSFLSDGMHHDGLKYMQVLEKRYSNDHRVIANIGAMHMALKNDTEASKYLVRAVQMNHDDPLNNWNLARFYDFTNRNLEADRYYKKALELYARVEPDREGNCVYADFLEKKMKDATKAKELRSKYCR